MPALIMILLIPIRLPLLSFYTICITEEAIKSVPQTECGVNRNKTDECDCQNRSRISSQDGKIGTGGIIETNGLSKGTHRITLVTGEEKKGRKGFHNYKS
jgi:hypothetical protein